MGGRLEQRSFAPSAGLSEAARSGPHVAEAQTARPPASHRPAAGLEACWLEEGFALRARPLRRAQRSRGAPASESVEGMEGRVSWVSSSVSPLGMGPFPAPSLPPVQIVLKEREEVTWTCETQG